MHKQATLIITHYITYLSFQLLRNHRILQQINFSFLFLKVLVKTGTFHSCSNGTSKYFISFLTNILLRSERFTEQSFVMENKILLRTVLRSFLHKLERNLMQSLELASIVSQKDTYTLLLANIVFTCKHCEILSIKYLCVVLLLNKK